MKKLKCPYCQDELESVDVHVTAYQTAQLDGNTITSYSTPEDFEPEYYLCPNCMERLDIEWTEDSPAGSPSETIENIKKLNKF